MINELSKTIHANYVKKGFYEGEKNIGEMLALIHSEVSEALEADRKDHHCIGSTIKVVNTWEDDSNFQKAFTQSVKDTFEDELADVLIRVLDMAGFLNIDLAEHVDAKLRFNSLRPHKHGKKY
jgi:NTP pyrophosphatase (non-canonical NTP hydrolase)